MTANEIKWIAMRQSALDANCQAEDYLKNGNTVVLSQCNPGRKKCFTKPLFCQLTTYGNGVVASVDPLIREFISHYLDRQDHPAYCFDTPQILALNRELERYGQSVCYLAEFFLPNLAETGALPSPEGVTFRVMEQDEIPSLFSDPRFHMALGYQTEGDKRDVLAVAGYCNGELAGVAGASNDCETMWQVGIDVIPAYRGRGIAAALTRRLTEEVLNRGKVPFYCTAWSNIASKRNAVASGYRTAWVEVASAEAERVQELIKTGE